MLAGHQHVHVVPAADAVIEAGKQAVGVRRKVKAHHVRFLIGNVIQEAGVLMGEAVVILLPYVGGEDQVQGGDGLSPGKLVADLQPFRMLGAHGIHHADERLIAGEEAVASREKIALQPALAHVLAEEGVHHAAVMGQEFIRVQKLVVPVAVCLFKHLSKAVGHGLVRPEDAEVVGVLVELENIPDKAAQFHHILGFHRAGSGHIDAVIAEVGHAQVAQQLSAVGVGVGAYLSVSHRSQSFQLRDQLSVLIKKLFRMVAHQPVSQHVQMLRLIHHDRHLMGAEGAFDLLAVHHFRSRPALGRAQHDHGPLGSGGIMVFPGVFLNGLDIVHGGIQGFGHFAVHFHGNIAFHKIRLPAAAVEEMLQFFMGDAGQHRRIADLIAV